MTVPPDTYADDLYAVEASSSTTTRNGVITPFNIVVMLVVLGLIGVVGYGVYRSQQDTLNEGKAPDFTLRIYDDANIPYSDENLQMRFSGQEIRLSDFKGGVVVINVWQSNCPPCHEEAEMLERVFREYEASGVMFIGVNAKDPDRLAYEYLAQYNITYPNGLDRGDRIQDTYRTTGYPETFIIDPNGNISKHFAGPVTEAQLRAEIEKAMKTGNGL